MKSISEITRRQWAILDAAKAGRRALTAKEEAEYNALENQFRNLQLSKIMNKDSHEQLSFISSVLKSFKNGDDVSDNDLDAALTISRGLVSQAEEAGHSYVRNIFPAQADRIKPFLDAVYKLGERGTGSEEAVKGHLLPARTVMTSSNNSAGYSAFQGTSPEMYMQATASTAILREMTVLDARNNVRYPYINRSNRLASQNQATQTTALDTQAYVVSQITTLMQNYYALVLWHNDVQRDAAGDVAAWIMDAVQSDIQRSILLDILTGPGTNGRLTGLDYADGVLSIDAENGSVGDWSFLIRAKEALEIVNVNWENCAVLMHPSVAKQFTELADQQDQPLMLPIGIQNLAAKWYVSSVIPVEDDKSTIYIGDFSRCVLYVDGTYTITSRERFIEYDQSALLVAQRLDLKLREPDHLLRVTNVATVLP